MTAMLTFTVVQPAGIENPMIAGQVARLTNEPILGSLNSLRGQLVVVEDAHRPRPDGPLWLTILGTSRRDASIYPGTPIQCVMRDDEAPRLVAEWLPGTIRARQCLDNACDLRGPCYVVEHTPITGERTVQHVAGTAGDAAAAAWAIHDAYVNPTLIPA